ncbi:MAG: nucleoside triphosphate pyrophosphohydrolase [Actinomycetota bacterium]
MTISIVGLGPSGIDRVDLASRHLLEHADTVIVRTLKHPAATELAGLRSVVACDDLYESLEEFDDVYAAITERVLAAGRKGSVVYGVPGSAVVGERTVSQIRSAAEPAGLSVAVLPGLSFLDLAYIAVGLDPIADGLQILDARDLPDPMPLHVPTIITQVDSALRASDVSLALTRTIDADAEVTVLDRLGDTDEIVAVVTASELGAYAGGPRMSVFVPATPSGLLGLIATNRILRRECPWDRKQTHHTLLTHLIEEAYETADAIGHLPIAAPAGDPDFGAYAEVEEELGDLLLQVLFHATLAAEAGAFDIDEVAEGIRRKLVDRHPHVFGDVVVEDADEVLSNWEQIKKAEKNRESLMDDIPTGMPAIARAMKVQKRARSVGFDWDTAEQVFPVLRSEIEELTEAGQDRDAVVDELGDVLFTAINLARHLGVDPEVALRATVDKFISRFKAMESEFESRSADIASASPSELEQSWQSAKLVVG